MIDSDGKEWPRDPIEMGVDFRVLSTHCAAKPAHTPLNETHMNGAFARAVIESMEDASVGRFLEAIREREVHLRECW